MHVEEHHRKQIIVFKLYSKTIWIKDITGRLEMKKKKIFSAGLWIFLFLKKSILITLFVNILFTIFALHPNIYVIIIFCVSFSALVLCSQVFCRRSSVLTVMFRFLGVGFGLEVFSCLLFLLFIVSFILWSFFCYVHTTANDFLCMAGIFLSGNSLDLYPMVPLTLLLSEAICLPLHYLCCLLLSSPTLITFSWKIKWLEFKPNCPQFSTKNKCIIHTWDRSSKQYSKHQQHALI